MIPPLHDSDLFLRHAIELVHKGVDLLVGSLDQAVGCNEWLGSSPNEERTLELDEIPTHSLIHFCPTNSPYPKYSSRFSGVTPASRTPFTNLL